MSKHTPGPWFCENGDNRWTIWDDEGMACICDVHAGIEPDPSEANARLIAAAPDLLAACEALARSFDAVTYAAWTPEMHAAVAAIAKAKGEP